MPLNIERERSGAVLQVFTSNVRSIDFIACGSIVRVNLFETAFIHANRNGLQRVRRAHEPVLRFKRLTALFDTTGTSINSQIFFLVTEIPPRVRLGSDCPPIHGFKENRYTGWSISIYDLHFTLKEDSHSPTFRCFYGKSTRVHCKG